MQNMAKEKIQGWTDSLGCFQEGEKPEEIYCSFDAATLVVHDGDKHERVFTESEVRAILRDLLAAAEDGPFMPNYDRMDEMVKLHGLSFDPA